MHCIFFICGAYFFMKSPVICIQPDSSRKGRIAIGTVTSNQKLELVRMIRMQNQSNRNECREREQFLYGYPTSAGGRGEIYGTEAMSALDASLGKETYVPKEAFAFSGFRIRFLFAVILMVLFIYMDKSEGRLFGKTMEELTLYLTESIHLEETLNSFDL